MKEPFPLGFYWQISSQRAIHKSNAPSLCNYAIRLLVRIADRALEAPRLTNVIFNRFAATVGVREIRQSRVMMLRNFEDRRCERPPGLNQDEEAGGKNTSVRTSILSRAGAPGQLVGSTNAVWAVKRVCPGSES